MKKANIAALILIVLGLSFSIGIFNATHEQQASERQNQLGAVATLTLEIPQSRLGLDEKAIFSMRLKNISAGQFTVTKHVGSQTEGFPLMSHFLLVEPEPGSRIHASMAEDLVGEAELLKQGLIRILRPGEMDITQWEGSFRELIRRFYGVSSMSVVPGEYKVRAVYRPECHLGFGAGFSVRPLCSKLTSEAITIEVF
jgi:hypothetical protein